MIVPDSYLPPESQPWGRSVDQRIASLEAVAALNAQNVDNNLKQLAASVNLLANQVTRLNSNSVAYSTDASGTGDSLISTNQVVASLNFARPSWAGNAVILAISSVTTSTVDQATNPLGAFVRTAIGNDYVSATVDVSTKATAVFSTKVVPLSVTFATTASNIVVSTQITGTGGSISNSWSAQLSAIAFWYP